jgi:hypothetical protein
MVASREPPAGGLGHFRRDLHGACLHHHILMRIDDIRRQAARQDDDVSLFL